MTTLDEINKRLDAMKPYQEKTVRLLAALRYAVNELCTERDEDHILSILKGETS